jgi:hypothetical protein
VSPMTLKVLLCVMRHWSALSLLSARVRTEEGHVKALMSRTHQLRALVNKDNPQNVRQKQASVTSDTPDGDRGHKMNTVSWGAYLYGAVVLLGIMIHEQTEDSRQKG